MNKLIMVAVIGVWLVLVGISLPVKVNAGWVEHFCQDRYGNVTKRMTGCLAGEILIAVR